MLTRSIVRIVGICTRHAWAVIVLAVAFLANGGDRFFGKKTIESDNDLPPVHTSEPKAK